MRLHKPKKTIWNAALIIFIVGVVVAFVPLPPLQAFFGGWALWLVMTSAALMLLGTSVLR